jgi:hypothetical protein
VERAQLARHKAQELEAKLPTLTIVVPPAADRPDLQITRDREVLGRPAWGVPIPVDPGVHTIEASAPGRKPWQAQATTEGVSSAASVEVPPLEADPTLEPAPGAAPGAATPLASAHAPTDSGPAAPPASPGSGQRVAGLVLGGVGVAGIIAGSVFGLVAKSDDNKASQHCLTSDACDSEGITLNDSAHHAATVSTIAFLAGGVLAATGVIVYVTAPRRGSSAVSLLPMVAPGTGGLALRGGW